LDETSLITLPCSSKADAIVRLISFKETITSPISFTDSELKFE